MKKLVLFSVLTLPLIFALAQSEAPTVEGTISALQGGLTSLPVDAAVANIKGWQAQLSGSDDPIVQGIANQLGELSTALQADTINSAEVANLLSGLGTDTVSASEGATDAQLKAQLIELGNLLLSAGSSLTGGASGGTASGGAMSGGMMSGGN